MMGERGTSHWIVRMNYRNRALVAVLLFLTLGSHLLNVARCSPGACWSHSS